MPSPEDQPTVISHRPPLTPSSSPGGTIGVVASQLPIGTRLEQFELLEYVGGGGMGRVFRAMDTTLGRPVALKILSREQAADTETLLRFRNEARSAARLNHDGIVQVYYVGEDAGLPFIAFEFVEGVNVRALVEQKGPLPLGEAVSYTLQVAEALAHAAQRSVVHRDIKPSNILIAANGRAKLIDMGLARLQAADNPAADLTASGVTLGTFDYISPEQARDPRVADVRSDIYSLGCTLFYMLTGRPPFPEGNVLQKLLQHQGEEPPDVRAFRPDLPDEVSRVVRKMMAKDPRRRYQDPSRLIMALLVLAELAGLQRVGPGQTVWVTPKEVEVGVLERHLPWLAPVMALGCIVLLLHVLWSSSALKGDPSATAAVEVPAGEVLEPPLAEDLWPLDNPIAEVSPEAETLPKAVAEPPSPAPASKVAAAPEKPPAPSPAGKLPANAEPPAKPATTEKKPAAVAGADRPATAKPVLSAGLAAEALEGSLSLLGGLSGELSVPKVTAESRRSEGAPSAESRPPAPALPRQAELFVLDPKGNVRGAYPTLSAACAAANSGDVIELRYSGRRDERPFRVAGRQLTLRAPDGYRPVVVFRPSEIDPIRYSRSMIVLGGEQWTATGIAFELDVPRDVPADRWSFLELGEGQRVDLRQCSLTIRNHSDRQTAYHPDVAFFRLKSALAEGMIGSALTPLPRAAVTLTDCVARGEAVFVGMELPMPLTLKWTNGLLVTSEHLLKAEGGERIALAEESIRMELQHVTAVVRNGLCRFHQTEFAPHPWPVQIQTSHNVFLAAPASALLEQLGVGDVAEALARLSWDGTRNWYEGFTIFWAVRPLAPDTSARVMTFDDWQAHWQAERESAPAWNGAQWQQLPDPSQPVHRQVVADYTLRPAVATLPGTAEAELPGAQAESLPPLPPEQDELTSPSTR